MYVIIYYVINITNMILLDYKLLGDHLLHLHLYDQAGHFASVAGRNKLPQVFGIDEKILK